jgi:hypothetical protein
MVTPVAPSTSNINDRLQCRRHLKADESGATAGILAIRLRPMRCPRRKVGLPEQFSLFADRLSGPEGLRYSEEFVSPAAEKTLMGHIVALPAAAPAAAPGIVRPLIVRPLLSYKIKNPALATAGVFVCSTSAEVPRHFGNLHRVV